MSPDEVAGGLRSGMTIGIGGWGSRRKPMALVRAIAQLARTMPLITVAEYVETEEIRARVATLGVDYGQGFAISRPLPLDDLLADLTGSADGPRSGGKARAAASPVN